MFASSTPLYFPASPPFPSLPLPGERSEIYRHKKTKQNKKKQRQMIPPGKRRLDYKSHAPAPRTEAYEIASARGRVGLTGCRPGPRTRS